MEKARQAARWIVEEARRLGVKTIAYPDCGHAPRTLLSYFEGWFGDEIAGIEGMSVVQLMASYLAEGRIRVQPSAFDMPLTYHDPCNLGRNAGIYEEPRTLIRAVATEFRELTPNRALNRCCGGGGGLIAEPEMKEGRMRAGRPKVEQIHRSGAQWVIPACENCETQLRDLNEHYELGIAVSLAYLEIALRPAPRPTSLGLSPSTTLRTSLGGGLRAGLRTSFAALAMTLRRTLTGPCRFAFSKRAWYN